MMMLLLGLLLYVMFRLDVVYVCDVDVDVIDDNVVDVPGDVAGVVDIVVCVVVICIPSVTIVGYCEVDGVAYVVVVVVGVFEFDVEGLVC